MNWVDWHFFVPRISILLFLFICAGLAHFWWAKYRKTNAELVLLRDAHEKYIRNPSILAHEIRSPLTVIIGASELLADEAFGELNERQSQLVSRIEQNSMLLQDMAEDFLTDARIDAEIFELKIQNFDVVALIRKIAEDLNSTSNVSISVHRRGRPIWIQADIRLIRQALTNLINNAIKHAGDGAKVMIRPYRNDEECVIEVSDNGVGMSSREKESLFTPFVTGQSRSPGTGLGMMITKKIIDLHQGRILVDSITQHGTTIFVILPYVNKQGRKEK